MAKPMVRQIATYQVRPEALGAVLDAIRALVASVKANEPGTLRYEAWQGLDDPTRFTHIFVFRDAESEQIHSDSPATKRFASVLYPQCLAPVSFRNHELIASNQSEGRV